MFLVKAGAHNNGFIKDLLEKNMNLKCDNFFDIVALGLCKHSTYVCT